MRSPQNIQMQYASMTEQAVMGSFPITKSLLPTTNSQVQQTRKVFMILVGLAIALSMGSSGISLFAGSVIENYPGNNRRVMNIIEALTWIIFYGFGLFAAYRYSETGLHVFAWFGIIALVVSVFLIGFLIFMIFLASATFNNIRNESGKMGINLVSTDGYIIILISIIDFILTVIVVSHAFKLARLIGTITRINIQQI